MRSRSYASAIVGRLISQRHQAGSLCTRGQPQRRPPGDYACSSWTPISALPRSHSCDYASTPSTPRGVSSIDIGHRLAAPTHLASGAVGCPATMAIPTP